MKRATMPQFEDLLLSLQLKQLEDEALLDFWEESQAPITPVIDVKKLKHVRSMQKKFSSKMTALPKNPLTELVTALQKKHEALSARELAETGFDIEIESNFPDNFADELADAFSDELLESFDNALEQDLSANAPTTEKVTLAEFEVVLDEPYLPAELEELLVNFSPQDAQSSIDNNHTRVMAIPLFYLQGKQHHNDFIFSKQERLILQELQLRSVMRATGTRK